MASVLCRIGWNAFVKYVYPIHYFPVLSVHRNQIVKHVVVLPPVIAERNVFIGSTGSVMEHATNLVVYRVEV